MPKRAAVHPSFPRNRPFGAGSAAAHRALGEALAGVTDEAPAAAIAAVDALLASGGLRAAVAAAVGPLREVARA